MFNFNYKYDTKLIARRGTPVYLRDKNFIQLSWIESLLNPLQGIEKYNFKFDFLITKLDNNNLNKFKFSFTHPSEPNKKIEFIVERDYITIKRTGKPNLNFTYPVWIPVSEITIASRLYNKLQEYAQYYFDDLKITTEVNNKDKRILNINVYQRNKYVRDKDTTINVIYSTSGNWNVKYSYTDNTSTYTHFLKYKEQIEEELSRTNNVVNLQYKLNMLFDPNFDPSTKNYTSLPTDCKIRIIHYFSSFDTYTRFADETTNHIILGFSDETITGDQVYLKYTNEGLSDVVTVDFIIEVENTLYSNPEEMEELNKKIAAYVDKYKAAGLNYSIENK
jgi:hypothetical protein